MLLLALLLPSCAAQVPCALPAHERLCESYEVARMPVGGTMAERRDFIESLERPVPVLGVWDGNLVLKDGRRVSLRGVRVSSDDPVLREVTWRGVEVKHDCAYGLLNVWHWCGNDPVGRHVALVDVAEFLRFCAGTEAGMFGRFDYGDFNEFRAWQQERMAARDRAR